MAELLERVRRICQKHNIELPNESFKPIDKECFEQALVRSVRETVALFNKSSRRQG